MDGSNDNNAAAASRRARAEKKLRDALSAADPVEPSPRPRRKRVSVAQSQSIEGDGNTQIGSEAKVRQAIKGNNNTQVSGAIQALTVVTGGTAKIHVAPPPNSIGANAILKERITALFNKLGLERQKRLGKAAFASMYSNFKRDFDIPGKLPWHTIWLWPEARAGEIASYLEGKYANTISGRVEKAARAPGYKHTRQHLFARERDFLEQLDLKPKDPEVLEKMVRLFGTDTHKELTHQQHTQWVEYLETLVDRQYEPAD